MPDKVMQIDIYDNGTMDIKWEIIRPANVGMNPIEIGAVNEHGADTLDDIEELPSGSGKQAKGLKKINNVSDLGPKAQAEYNSHLAIASPKAKGIASIVNTNPCTWVNMNGKWYYV